MKILTVTLLLILISESFNVSAQPLNKSGVGQRTLSFEDKSRSRKLITEIWYPTPEKALGDEGSPFFRMPTARDASVSTGTFPLVLFSHGTGGGRLTVEWLCAGLAAQGFIVAAVDHFGNTFDNPIPVEFAKVWERPQDIRFVLDQLLTAPEIASSIETNRIGAAGFSLGGYTAIALAGAKMDYPALQKYFKSEKGRKEADIPEMPGLLSLFEKPEIQDAFEKAPPLIDKRIKSVFVLSPAIGQAFPTRENFRDVIIPVYIVAVGKDQITPPKTNAEHYAKMIKTSQYKLVDPGAGHYVFLSDAKDPLKKEAPIFFDDAPGVNRKVIHEQALQLAIDHFKKTLK